MNGHLFSHSLAWGMFLATGPIMTAPLQAKPDFTASEFTAQSETVREGEVAQFRLLLRNRGDEGADPVHVSIKMPLMGHLVEASGAENMQIDHDAREVTADVPLPAGGERTLNLTVLAPRDSGGAALSMSAQIIHYHTMAETWVHKTIQVDTRPRTDGFVVGGVRMTPASIATLAWLAVTGLALVAVSFMGGSQGFFSARAGVTAIMIAIGFWLIFGAMAWRDYRVFNKWTETTATIVSRRVAVQSVSNSQRRVVGTTSSGSSDISKPEFALRYPVDGREMLSTGYDTGSSLRVGGGQKQLEKEFTEWTVGTRIPCWYDPNDPTDVVIKRGFGGAYLFALLPVFPFWLGLFILRRSRSREN